MYETDPCCNDETRTWETEDELTEFDFYGLINATDAVHTADSHLHKTDGGRTEEWN